MPKNIIHPLSHEDEKRIKNNFGFLKQELVQEEIRDHFLDEGLWDLQDLDDIDAEKTPTKKNEKFLRLLLQSGPSAYGLFIEALKKKQSFHIVDRLQQTQTVKGLDILQKTQMIQGSPEPSTVPDGEQLRKTTDDAFPYRDGDILYRYDLQYRIGCVQNSKGTGTGFRVGSKYVLTAFHVVQDVLEDFWNGVYDILADEEKNKIKWNDKCIHVHVPQDGKWSLDYLIQKNPSMKHEKLATLREFAEHHKKQLKFKFGFVNKDDGCRQGHFSTEVAFASPSFDVAILELTEVDVYPEPIHLLKTNANWNAVHIFGHPGGSELLHDPQCIIIKRDLELDEIKRKGIEYFGSQKYDKELIENDYKTCVLSRDRILFHCSKSTSHGSSGSPLIIILENKPQVAGMLQKGHPTLYYNHRNWGKEQQDVLVESGISMEKVHSLLKESNLHDLANDLFSS